MLMLVVVMTRLLALLMLLSMRLYVDIYHAMQSPAIVQMLVTIL